MTLEFHGWVAMLRDYLLLCYVQMKITMKKANAYLENITSWLGVAA